MLVIKVEVEGVIGVISKGSTRRFGYVKAIVSGGDGAVGSWIVEEEAVGCVVPTDSNAFDGLLNKIFAVR